MAASSEAVTTTPNSDEYIRVHITPFNSSLLRAILPPSILPKARNISYHTIETFPEKGYGYVDLPAMDAEKIKKKLNGSILKGSKMRIEQARPQNERVVDEPDEPEKSKKARKESKKRKRESNIIPGAEIGERSVKRGWTTPSTMVKSKDEEVDAKKTKIKSKYTMGPECLFKTVIPANIAKTSKATDKVEKKKRSKPGKEAVVHEYAKTTKYASFLRSTSAGNKKVTAEFVEGKGWVDEEGNVVEEVVKKSPKVSKPRKREPTPEPVIEEESSSSEQDSNDAPGSSTDEPDTEVAAPVAKAPFPRKTATTQPAAEDSATSSSGSSSEESDSDSEDSSDSSDAESSSEVVSTPGANKGIDSRSVSRPQSSSGPGLNLSIKIPSPPIAAVHVSAEVHPLEALYKRAKHGTEEAPEPEIPSFSFFGADVDNDEEIEEATDKVPLTPFTQKDFEYRGLRSAAPTPDTAHANKRFLWPTLPDDNEDDDDDEAPSSPIRNPKGESSNVPANKGKGKEKDGEEESDFQKWFYANRGDTNRAWKKRRKVAGKEKRHRENKKRTDRMV